MPLLLMLASQPASAPDALAILPLAAG